MKHFFVIVLFLFVSSVYAQEKSEEEHPFYKKNPYYAGLGVGYDFGGIGGKLEYMFLDYGGLFVGVGYNLVNVGLNGGVMIKPVPKKQVTPYFLGMYGYTGAVVIKNASKYNKADIGFSLGAGLEIKTEKLNAWQLGLILPFRSQGFKNHYQELQDNPAVQLPGDLFPIGFSIGFKMLI